MTGRAVAALALALTACTQAAPPPRPTPTPAPTTPSPTLSPTATPAPKEEAPDLDRVRVRLVRIATLEQPLALALRKGDRALYIAEKTGRVRRLLDGRTATVLDLRSQVSDGGEQGLLGLAFSPDGDFLYVNFTNREGDTRVIEYRMNGRRADTGTRRQILSVDQPYANHNGGNILFGPDGYLYIGLGDGGSARDPQNNGQDLGTLLGKMLRIDPRGGRPYRVPRDNPFVGREGRDEIWAYGLRNPWRWSFDRRTGDLWIGDVGQSSWEEIDYQGSYSNGGENYGWALREGREALKGAKPRGAVDPVHEYPTGDGCAVTGGYVYRGGKIDHLAGAYVFGDFCNGRITALVREGRRASDVRGLGIEVGSLASFGEDRDGDLYALSLEGGVFRIAPR